MYEGAFTNVRTICDKTMEFHVGAGLRQGSALSGYMFSMNMDDLIL